MLSLPTTYTINRESGNEELERLLDGISDNDSTLSILYDTNRIEKAGFLELKSTSSPSISKDNSMIGSSFFVFTIYTK